MHFWIGLGAATALVVAALIILATKAGFPQHRMIAIALYGASWLPFLYSISLRKEWLLQQQGPAISFFSAFWIHIAFGVVMLGLVYVFLVMFPVAKSPFIGLEAATISKKIDEDAALLRYLDDRLAHLIDTAETQKIFAIDFLTASNEQKAQVTGFWTSYIEILIELDVFKDRYKTFYQLPIGSQKEQHIRAFKMGLAALLAQHHYTLILSNKIENHHFVSFLNEEVTSHGVAPGTYDRILLKLTNSDETVRRSAGKAYYAAVGNTHTDEIDALIHKYFETIDAAGVQYAELSAEKPLALLERHAESVWFPIQKESAKGISYIRTTKRDYHITPDIIQSYKERFEPGDILLERREWHATNVGIPGYWTHSALYLGTLEELNTYFSDLPQLEGKSFETYVKETFPEVHMQLRSVDTDGYPYAVIESKRPGVILMSLEGSAKADSLAVLRVPGLSKSDQFKIVTQAFSHFGKPYDFNFNFVTENAMVCSELVYKAFTDVADLALIPQEFNGRSVISPNQFAQRFVEEEGSFELVLFLDGNEKEGTVTERNAGVFSGSWQRPKWHIARDYMQFE